MKNYIQTCDKVSNYNYILRIVGCDYENEMLMVLTSFKGMKFETEWRLRGPFRIINCLWLVHSIEPQRTVTISDFTPLHSHHQHFHKKIRKTCPDVGTYISCFLHANYIGIGMRKNICKIFNSSPAGHGLAVRSQNDISESTFDDARKCCL
jgi:hypothetical protein